jgi:DNA-directed RNA polymerase subunit RPC12/RpoP
LVLTHGSVSGRHARLGWKGRRIVVEDLGSANGTFVAGKRVDKEAVRPGDDVRLGRVSLPWSDPALKAFLRSGARGDTLRSVKARERSFVCGACGAQGSLPAEARGSERLRCAACGARLSLGTRPGRISRLAVAVLVGSAVVGALAVAVVAASRGSALGSLGLGGGNGRHTEEDSVRSHTAPNVIAALDADHPTTRNTAVRIAAEEQGPFRLEQVARVWTHVRGRWRYVNDPRGNEYFARASETIENGFAGDCDDFSIVLASMLTAIGGDVRVVMMDGPEGGHAYTEVCVEEEPTVAVERLRTHYRRTWDQYLGRQRIHEIHYRSSPQCRVWLNLDWNAGVPGGAYSEETWAVAIYPDGRTETLYPAPPPRIDGVPAPDPPRTANPPSPAR